MASLHGGTQRRRLQHNPKSSAVTSGTPGSPGQDATLCPQPRRAYPPPSPGEDVGSRSPGNELRELLSNSGTPGNGGISGMKACTQDGHVSGPFSEMSTSAGATPSPDGRASPHPWPPTPDSQRNIASPSSQGPLVSGSSCLGALGSSSSARRRGPGKGVEGVNSGKVLGLGAPGAAPGPTACSGNAGVSGNGSGPPRQAGKVFVGGVPQDMSQDDLYNIFSEYGGVKKAWLQSYRTAGRINQSPPHNHRGFGFVIFYDGSSVDVLLGKNYSRYLQLQDGRLEVKRAVPSSDLPGKPSPGSPAAGPDPRSNRGRGSSGAMDLMRGPSASAVVPPPLPALAGSQPPPAQATYQMSPQPLPGSGGSWPGGAVHGGQPTWPTPWPAYMPQQSQAMTMPGVAQAQALQHQQQPQPLTQQLHPQQHQQHGLLLTQMPYASSYSGYPPAVAQAGGMPVGQAQQGLPQSSQHHQHQQHQQHQKRPVKSEEISRLDNQLLCEATDLARGPELCPIPQILCIVVLDLQRCSSA